MYYLCFLKKKYTLLILLLSLFIFVSCSNENKELDMSEDINITSDVTISVKENSISNQGLTLLIANETEKDCSYDVTYKLELKQDDGWLGLNNEQVFSGNVWVLNAASTNEFPVTWEHELKKNREYRIVKPVVTSDGIQYLFVEFTI